MFVGFTGQSWNVDREASLYPGADVRRGRLHAELRRRAHGGRQHQADGLRRRRRLQARQVRGAPQPGEVHLQEAARRADDRGGDRPRRCATTSTSSSGSINPQNKNLAAFQLHVNPLVSWIWFGCIVLIAGSIVCMWPQLELGESRVWAGARGRRGHGGERRLRRSCSRRRRRRRRRRCPGTRAPCTSRTTPSGSSSDRSAACAGRARATCSRRARARRRGGARQDPREAARGRGARSDHRRVRGGVRPRGARRSAEHGRLPGHLGRAGGRASALGGVRARAADAAVATAAERRPQADRRPAGAGGATIRTTRASTTSSRISMTERTRTKAGERARDADGATAQLPRRTTETRPSDSSGGPWRSGCRVVCVAGRDRRGVRGERRLGAPGARVGRAARDDRAALGERPHAERRRAAARRARGAARRGSRDVDALAEQKRRVLRALKDLENEHALGKIDDADYEAIAMQYRDEAKAMMREMDRERRAGPGRGREDRAASTSPPRASVAPSDRRPQATAPSPAKSRASADVRDLRRRRTSPTPRSARSAGRRWRGAPQARRERRVQRSPGEGRRCDVLIA